MTNAKLKKLEKSLSTAKDPVQRIEIIKELVPIIIDRDIERGHALIDEMASLSTRGKFAKAPYQAGVAWSLFYRGWYHLRRSEHELAFDAFHKAEKIFSAPNAPKGMQENANGLGMVYLQKAQFDKAFEYFLQSLGTDEESLEPFLLSGILNNLGVLYIELGEYKTAQDYIQRSLVASRSIDNLQNQAAALDNQSNIYYHLKDYPNALHCALESLKLSRHIGSKVYEAESLNSLGDAYKALGEHKKAMQQYKLAHELASKIGHTYEKVEAMVRIGSLYLEEGAHKTAGKYLYPALSLAREAGAARLEYQTYHALAQLNEADGDYKLALQYYKFYHDIQQEVFGLQADWRLKTLRVLHQVETDENLRLSNARLQDRLREIESLQHQLEEQATRDPLTGLYNRRYLDETLTKELARQKRERGSLSLIIMDIDLFKEVNDQFGHQAGDEVLIALGKLLTSHTRASDMVYRYGGDEFVVALPGAEPEEALQRGIEWRKDFAKLKFSFPQEELQPSISLGIASYPQNADSLDSLFRAADEALYASKVYRNRVTLSKKA